MERTIGKLADAAGVHVETVRYYERIGLIEQPPKPERGWRTYDEDALNRIKFIKRAQELGLSLEEIRQLLELRQTDMEVCGRVREIALGRRDELNARIRDLEKIRDSLNALIDECPGTGYSADCPILEYCAFE